MADQTRDRVADLHQRITAALTTLHALAEECEAHASEWDQWDDPDGHAAAWDAWVEHVAKIRPDLAPAAVDDIVTAEGSDHA